VAETRWTKSQSKN